MNRSLDHLIARCHILQVEPNIDYSQTLDSMLQQNGVASFRRVASCKAVNPRILNRRTDILLLDHDVDFGAAGSLVRRIRRAETEADPFMAVFATQSTVSESTLEAEKSAGLDGILLKPFSLDSLFAHIGNIAHSERRFVNSRVYVGPDRRESNRKDPRSVVYTVPNRLSLKLEDDIVADDVRKWRAFWLKKLAEPEYYDV
ncbi:MAG: hypothetical protein RIM72_13395 [Alphaproteobacteria bacterium]